MVHSETLKAYELAGYDYNKTPHDIAEQTFNNWIKQSGRNPTIIVNRITRIKASRDKNGNNEFLTWSERRIGYDHVGNERAFTEDKMGKYDIPVFRHEWDTSSNTIRAVQIERHETVYWQAYTPEKIDELYENADETKCQFYVQIGSQRYSITSFNDFRNGDFDKLVQLGKSEAYYLNEIYPPEEVVTNNTVIVETPPPPSGNNKRGKEKNENSPTNA